LNEGILSFYKSQVLIVRLTKEKAVLNFTMPNKFQIDTTLTSFWGDILVGFCECYLQTPKMKKAFGK
jgi:hypothetical protein